MHYYKVVDVSVNKQTKIVKNVKITTNRVKMLVDIMIIVSYNSKYKVKTNKMQQKYRKILEIEATVGADGKITLKMDATVAHSIGQHFCKYMAVLFSILI